MMYRLIVLLFVLSITACSSEKKSGHTENSNTDTLMDSTTLKLKNDTTLKVLDHLEDSINDLKQKAAENAGQ